jgi:mono/diheme cytochrome c family protein
VPRAALIVLLLLGSLALVPFACIARARAVRSPSPRLHLVPDMDNQGRFKAQQPNPLFADRRAMRRPVQGTVARGMLKQDDHLYRGLVNGEYATELPPLSDLSELSGRPGTVERPRTLRWLLDRGRQRYEITCAPCHGLAGYGDGVVSRRAEQLQQGTWVPPSSFHDEPAASRPVGHVFNTITHGIRNMPAYGTQVPVEDRWASVAYVRALQRSQRARVEDVPPELRDRLR